MPVHRPQRINPDPGSLRMRRLLQGDRILKAVSMIGARTEAARFGQLLDLGQQLVMRVGQHLADQEEAAGLERGKDLPSGPWAGRGSRPTPRRAKRGRSGQRESFPRPARPGGTRRWQLRQQRLWPWPARASAAACPRRARGPPAPRQRRWARPAGRGRSRRPVRSSPARARATPGRPTPGAWPPDCRPARRGMPGRETPASWQWHALQTKRKAPARPGWQGRTSDSLLQLSTSKVIMKDLTPMPPYFFLRPDPGAPIIKKISIDIAAK